jgi:hypothetical protein
MGSVDKGIDEAKSQEYQDLIAKYEECNKCLCKVCTPCPAVGISHHNDLTRKPNDDYCRLMKAIDVKSGEFYSFLVSECGIATYTSNWEFLIKLWLHIIRKMGVLNSKDYGWVFSSVKYFNFDFCITNRLSIIKNHLLTSLKEVFGYKQKDLVSFYNEFIESQKLNIAKLEKDDLEGLLNTTVDIYDAVIAL